MGLAVFFGDFAQGLDEFRQVGGAVGGGAGEDGRIHAGRAVERVDTEAAVVRQGPGPRGQARRQGQGFLPGVAGESAGVLGDGRHPADRPGGKNRHAEPVPFRESLEFPRLVVVARGEVDRLHVSSG